MSTIGTYKPSFEYSDTESSAFGSYRTNVSGTNGQAAPLSDLSSFKAANSPSWSRGSGWAKHQRVNPKRRLRGFLVEMQTNEARVAFIEGGQTVLYDLPSEQLRKAGITLKNQPFQMDEFEGKSDEGGWFIGYCFLALAKECDAEIEILDFDEEYQRKRKIILSECSKAEA